MQWWLWSQFGGITDQAGATSYGLWFFGGSGAQTPSVEQAGAVSYPLWFYGGIGSVDDPAQVQVRWVDGNYSDLTAW